ncbi:MAG: hypothetical protein SGARI_002463 [Bacillariaceae sp.]
MTSLNYFTRTIRRHGTVVKLEYMDAPASVDGDTTKDRRMPSAVHFSLVGLSRCRVVGPRQAMKTRIGRWRRAYDEKGEETKLGWGEERFTNAPECLTPIPTDEDIQDGNRLEIDPKLSHLKWTGSWVQVNLEQTEKHAVESDEDMEGIAALTERLPSMVDEWVSLASNIKTYENTNVTASTRIKVGEPGLWIEPETLLKQIKKKLGPIPSAKDDPTAFCFWVAALINPLPVLGVSLEIRGKLLEAPTVKQRLLVVEMGLTRSIDNLIGKRPL